MCFNLRGYRWHFCKDENYQKTEHKQILPAVRDVHIVRCINI